MDPQDHLWHEDRFPGRRGTRRFSYWTALMTNVLLSSYMILRLLVWR